MAIKGERIALMFVTSQQRGRWILPKGNLKEGETHAEGCSREAFEEAGICLLYTSPSPRDLSTSRMPSSA